jgi:hypothetical protein
MWTDREDLGAGIYRYAGVFDPNIPERLESILNSTDKGYKPHDHISWQPAYVGYQQRMPEYRDCVDFKFKKEEYANNQDQASKDLVQIWQECYDAQIDAINDYCAYNGVAELRYMEAFNFIRYEPGQHFMEHTDHGFSYNCVVSSVGYFNDDYDGGELYFRRQGLNIKPKAGDLYLFPSTYVYPHQAKEVLNGTKYSIVTMLDYSAKYHHPSLYSESGD